MKRKKVFQTRYGLRSTLAQRFWAKVDKNGPEIIPGSPCWIFTGTHNKKGYGLIGLDYTMVLAHRIAHELCIGPIPDGLNVLHRCDNPPCIRWDHLRAGTQAENQEEMAAKGRWDLGGRRERTALRSRGVYGERHPRSHLKLAQVNEALEQIANGRETAQGAARRLGVANETVLRFCRGDSWSRETDPDLRRRAGEQIAKNRRNYPL